MHPTPLDKSELLKWSVRVDGGYELVGYDSNRYYNYVFTFVLLLFLLGYVPTSVFAQNEFINVHS